MERIAARQIHSEDVRAIWLMTPPDPGMKQYLAEHVATHTFGRTLKAKSSYYTLREEIPEFHEAINKLIDEKKAARTKQREDERRDRKAAFAGRGRTRDGHFYGQRLPRPQKNAEKNIAEGTVPEEANTETEEKHVVLKAQVVRRGKKGQPTFAKLDLGAIGVTKERFCA
jgi:hypothetical protein